MSYVLVRVVAMVCMTTLCGSVPGGGTVAAGQHQHGSTETMVTTDASLAVHVRSRSNITYSSNSTAVQWMSWYVYAKPYATGLALNSTFTTLFMEQNMTKARAHQKHGAVLYLLDQGVFNKTAMSTNVDRRRGQKSVPLGPAVPSPPCLCSAQQQSPM